MKVSKIMYKALWNHLDQNFKKKIRTFKGYTAQIIQHELDHFEGKII